MFRRALLAVTGLVGVASPTIAQDTGGPSTEIVPCEVQTVSNGRIVSDIHEYGGSLNITYETVLRARIEGSDDALFQRTFYRRIDDPIGQQAIDDGKQALMAGSGPAIVTFELVENTDAYYEEFLDSFTEYSDSFVNRGAATTVQVTNGSLPDAYVFPGECYTFSDTGVSGNTNGVVSGYFATCEDGTTAFGFVSGDAVTDVSSPGLDGWSAALSALARIEMNEHLSSDLTAHGQWGEGSTVYGGGGKSGLGVLIS